MQPATLANNLSAGAQPQVIRVAQDNPRIKFCGFESFKARALDIAERANGHEDRRLNITAPRLKNENSRKSPRTRAMLSSLSSAKISGCSAPPTKARRSA